jgi:hypothetical protein
VQELALGQQLAHIGPAGVYFEPSQVQLEVLLGFVGEYVHFEREEDVTELTVLMAGMGVETQEIREQVVHGFSSCSRSATSWPS